MFKYICKLMILLMLITTSCTTISCNSVPWGGGDSARDILPRTSFVKIEKVLKLKVCNPEDLEECFNQTLVSSGSGFVVKNDQDGSYIMTAGHVCDDSDVIRQFQRPNITIVGNKFLAIDIDKNYHNAKTIKFTMCEDMCIAYVPGLFRPAVKIAVAEPLQGDEVLNLAAPLGVFDTQMIPILHGHFSGYAYEGRAIYTVPAIGGSSGSAVFNRRGELIGMIHSAHIRFPFLSLSPTHKEVSDYIMTYANRRALLDALVN